jgi:hypothetical protein
MTRDHSGQRHPRTRQKNRQDAKPNEELDEVSAW